jgi:hypothetical protein
MKFKDLTDEQKELAKKIYTDREQPWDQRIKQLMNMFGKSERVTRRWCSEKLGFKEKQEIESEQYELAKKRIADKSKKYFLITWAQNNTPIHDKFFQNMKAYAEHLNADIHVIAGRYKNPTSVFTDKDFDSWDDKVVPYLDANRHDIHKYVSVMSDLKIQPVLLTSSIALA